MGNGATLVTGAAGFIGSHVVERLLALDERVVGYDDLNDWYSPAEKRANLRTALADSRFTLVEADIRDAVALRTAIASGGVRRVIHLAARAGVRPSLADPALYADVNVTGTARLLHECAQAGVEHIVHASSSSVYGADSPVPFVETAPSEHPMSPYAATKRANELQAWTHHHLTGATVTCLRFFTAYGPRNRPDMAVRFFAERILAGREIVLHGTGTQRDFTFVGDIADGVVAALQRPAGMAVCNLGFGRPSSVTTLIATLERLLGRSAVVRQVELPPGDVPITWADCSRAEALLGWRAQTSLHEGLATFVEWYVAGGHAAAVA